MKGTSKVIMGATLVMVVTLAIVIALILVLLAELYCSLLLRRRHHLRNTNTTTTTTQTTTPTSSPSHAPHSPPQHPPRPPPPPPPPPIYAPGVLQAPRSFLFPCMKEDMVIKEPNNHHHHHCELLHKVIHIQTQESNSNVFVTSPPISISPFMSRAPPQKDTPHDHEGTSVGEIPSCHEREQLVYISNPIYENEEGKTSGVNTPFETPDTSPSRLERSGSSGNDDDDDGVHSPTYTPPLTPMKKLPAEASSVSLRDARSLGTSASDSRSTVNGPSSSSSDSPCTSPSW